MSNWKKGKQLNDDRYTIDSILLRSSGNGILSYRAKNNQTKKLVTIKVIPAVWRQQPNGDLDVFLSLTLRLPLVR